VLQPDIYSLFPCTRSEPILTSFWVGCKRNDIFRKLTVCIATPQIVWKQWSVMWINYSKSIVCGVVMSSLVGFCSFSLEIKFREVSSMYIALTSWVNSVLTVSNRGGGGGGLNVPAADSNACNSSFIYPFCSKFSDFSANLSF